MKKWIPVFALFLLLVGGFFFWSLGSIAKEAPPKVWLTEAQGDVQTKAPGSDAWNAASAGQELPEGTSVRTGKDAYATVQFFDRSVSRLAPESMIVITRASKGATPANESDVRMKVESGRVWSRVMRLLDLSGNFSMETSDVVATVRGTAFDLQKTSNGTTLLVAHSVVEGNGMVAEGFMKRFGKGAPADRESISIEALTSDWVKDNEAKDQTFLRGFVGKGTVPSSLVDGLARWSEQLHVRVSPEGDRRALDARYLERRLERLRVMADQGQVGEASAQFLTLENEVIGRLSGKDAEIWRPILKGMVFRAWLAFDDVKPEQSAYRLKQRMEDLLFATAGAPDDRIYFRLLVLDARLDEAFDALSLGNNAGVAQAVDLVVQGLDNASRDVDQAAETVGPTQTGKLRTKVEAVRARLQALQLRLSQITFAPTSTSPIVSTTSTAPLPPTKTATSTPSAPRPTATSTPPTPAPTGLPYACASLAVIAQPNPIDAGMRATLYARAAKPDGTTADVTSFATFKPIGTLGTVSKNIFTATAAGSMQIQGSVTCNGQPVSGIVSIQINAGPVVPKSLTVTASPLTLGFLERSTLSAVLTYSNGVTKNVSASVVYESSNTAIGTISGSVFTAGQTVGSAIVTGSYTESGVTLTDSPTITVIDKSAQTTKP